MGLPARVQLPARYAWLFEPDDEGMMVALTPSRTAAPLAPKIVSLPWCTICLLSQASAKDGKFLSLAVFYQRHVMKGLLWGPGDPAWQGRLGS